MRRILALALAADIALGQPAEALPHAVEAVAIYREAAQLNPGRFNLHLAAALDTLARILSMLDRTAEAAAVRAEATVLRK
jgi:hypothetical protein